MKDKMVPRLRFPEFREAGEWEGVQLRELGQLVSGLTYTPDDVREDGLLVLRSSNIQNGVIVLDDCVYVTPEIKGANPTMPNDILICVRNGSKNLIGKNALIPKGLPRCTHGAFMTVFRSKSPQFVHQLFQTDSYYTQVSSDLGATINSINGSQFIKYKFFVPNPKEQQKIADCLSSLDDLITTQNQKLEALKTHKKGLMQQLFPAEGETVPRLRFSEFREAGEWSPYPLGEISRFSSGGTPSKEVAEYWGGSIPWISASSMYDTKINKSELNVTALAIGNGTRITKKGSLLILVRGSMLFNRVPIGIATVDVAFNQDVKALEVNASIFELFLLYQLISFESRIQINETGIGAGKIETDDLKNLVVFIPTKAEQQKIADCLSSLDDLITAQSQKLDALKIHKKGLMQQLFPNPNEIEE